MPLGLRVTVPPLWHQEGNAVHNPLRIWGSIAIFALKSEWLPCPRLPLWTHHSRARTAHRQCCTPSPAKPRAIADHRLQQRRSNTQGVITKRWNCFNAQGKNSRNLWRTNWTPQHRLGSFEPEENQTPQSQSASGTKNSAVALALCVMDWSSAEASPEENTLNYHGKPFHKAGSS